jgi:membrane-associated protease RseP (regulator of RpoE activity)
MGERDDPNRRSDETARSPGSANTSDGDEVTPADDPDGVTPAGDTDEEPAASFRLGESSTSGTDDPPGASAGGATSADTGAPPTPAALASLFEVYDVRRDGETVLYIGEPRASRERLERDLWSLFRDRGYDVSLQRGYTGGSVPISRGEHVLVAEPHSVGIDGIPWLNVVLFAATVLSTLFAGSVFWYQIPITEEPWRMVEAWPFTAAIIGVLGIHELGHYVLSRYHGVQASLPYFIPVPTYIGSLGAVIKMEGRIPDRKALFDIGVAGPLAGLVATVVVTVIGLQLDPLPVQEAAAQQASDEGAVMFNYPPLLELIAELTGDSNQLDGTVHPVVFGGWVGMLVTLLNMLPVGQLDGGHILRAMVGERQQLVARSIPAVLFGLAAYLLTFRGFDSVMIWAIWGLFALGLAYAGPANPIDDTPLDWPRIAVGVLAFVLGVLCFTPVPVEVIQPA